METFNNRVTNLDYLHTLAKGDTTFISEMITIFLTDMPQNIAALENAINDANYEQIKALSHHMKSTIPFVGLDLVVGKHITNIEKLAEEQKGIEIVKNMFTEVKHVCEKAYTELKH